MPPNPNKYLLASQWGCTVFFLTCSYISGVYLGGKEGVGGGVARPLSWQAGGMEFMALPVL
jgi:hypothetical protein